MFDNLRQEADSTPFYEDEAKFQESQRSVPAKQQSASSPGGHFLGLTPQQRFILAVMLLIVVCVLGSMLLLLTGRVGLV